MATTTDRPLEYEDIAAVRSRISWAAILAGSVMAVACYLVLTFFFAAVGLSLTDAGVRGNAVGIGAIVAAIITMAVALFLGGWVTTQLSVGENRREAAIYGVLTWAVVSAFTLFLVGMGVRAGYTALLGGTLVAQNSPAVQQRGWEDLARDAGVPQERIDAARQAADPNRVRAELNNPVTRDQIREGGMIAAWSAFGGTLLGIAACVAGAMAGRGATFRLFTVTVHDQRRAVPAA